MLIGVLRHNSEIKQEAHCRANRAILVGGALFDMIHGNLSAQKSWLVGLLTRTSVLYSVVVRMRLYSVLCMGRSQDGDDGGVRRIILHTCKRGKGTDPPKYLQGVIRTSAY